jgi:hypothetical protein
MVDMSAEEPRGGDSITVGDVTNAQGVAIGRNATATVTGNNVVGNAKVDPEQMRAALESLFDELEKAGMPKDKARTAQTAAGNAINAVGDKEVKSNVVADNVKKIGDTIKEANVAVKEGSSLWNSIKGLAPLLGPLVGGAHVVAGWFGLPL